MTKDNCDVQTQHRCYNEVKITGYNDARTLTSNNYSRRISFPLTVLPLQARLIDAELFAVWKQRRPIYNAV